MKLEHAPDFAPNLFCTGISYQCFVEPEPRAEKPKLNCLPEPEPKLWLFFAAIHFTKLFNFLNRYSYSIDKEFKYFEPKNLLLSSWKKWVGSGIQGKLIPDPDTRVKKAPEPGSATLAVWNQLNDVGRKGCVMVWKQICEPHSHKSYKVFFTRP